LFDPIHSVTYYCNRGTSGIDGSTSTAAGVSVVSANKLNVLITGDVSFLYDSNALWSEYIKSNFRIVVINNNGGGIFRIINGPEKSNQLETYFEAKHNYSAEKICDAFNVEYHALRDVDNFDAGMRDFYFESVNGRPKLIEIFTPHLKNDKVLKGFFEELRS
jgi:2-succinyl-5-enolpyruvyl-6-hydroxy-3-cyclohexene-1-carboxylate synthase